MAHSFVRWAYVAAMVAGGLLIVKAGSIMISGIQPPFIFEVAQILFLLSLFGLVLHLNVRLNRLQYLGGGLIILAILAWLSLVVYLYFSGTTLPQDEHFVFPASLLYLLANIAAFLGLITLGWAIWRAERKFSGWQRIPLIIGLFPLPAALTGIFHVEIPILLIGFSWIFLGVWMWYTNGYLTNIRMIANR